ncbi:uncharacterized protein LOC141900216 [Tubulanus polymorphus]|uniref:uncharacterized protein LOC141900216 n=1 Tax=Tubulanus polymorphus TaxID=672921 RepID=UPI003DA50605
MISSKAVDSCHRTRRMSTGITWFSRRLLDIDNVGKRNLSKAISAVPLLFMKRPRRQFDEELHFLPQFRRLILTGHQNPTYYYDVLHITPKATHKQIRDAYYKLSKIFHPDISTDKNSGLKFAEISAAYEVLGNKRRRKMYDRGFLDPTNTPGESKVEEDDADPRTNFHPGGFKKHTQPPPTGKSRIYDFDEFYRQHYGDTIKRNHYHKESAERFRQDELETRRDRVRGFTLSLFFMIIGSFLYMNAR